ncbi:hypothetical protein [Tautonia marina]|uniref:hypothetical protein n=1 Tax=Tautonia marina TaxID=2653855 RepID=UPI0012613031|nr:hypothetical protein [Tautonia marina]
MMPRPRQLVLAASLAAFAVGCAHCDTCDDFPAPCTGPNCGYPYQSAYPFEGGTHIEPIITGPTTVLAPTQMAPGSVISTPPNGAPSVQPPSPAPAQAPSSGSSSSASEPTSPPDSPPVPPRGTDPFDIPLPPADSPFSAPPSS